MLQKLKKQLLLISYKIRITQWVGVYTLTVYWFRMHDYRQRLLIDAYTTTDDHAISLMGKGYAQIGVGIMTFLMIGLFVFMIYLLISLGRRRIILVNSMGVLIICIEISHIINRHFIVSFDSFHLLFSSLLMCTVFLIKKINTHINLSIWLLIYAFAISSVFYFMEFRFEKNTVQVNSHSSLIESEQDNDEHTEEEDISIAYDGRLCGLQDSKENILVKPFADDIKIGDGDIHAFAKDDSWGLIKSNGDIIMEPFAEDIEFTPKGNGIFLKKEKWGIFDNKGIIVREPFANYIKFNKAGLGCFSKDGADLWGLVKSNGNIVKEAFADHIQVSTGNVHSFSNKENEWGLIHSNGDIIKEPFAEDIEFGVGDTHVFSKGDLWGIIDEYGTIVREPFSRRIQFEEEDVAFFFQQNKFGLINSKGEVIKEPFADYIYLLKDGFYAYDIAGECGLINDKGSIIRYPFATDMNNAYNGLSNAKIKSDKYYSAIMDFEGNVIRGYKRNFFKRR